MSQQSYSMDEVIVTVAGTKCEPCEDHYRVDPVPFSADTPDDFINYLGGSSGNSK